MNLEEKVMYLYEDILEPEQERKIVLLLKYVVIDGETDLNKIINEIGLKKAFIEKIINDDNVMLQYLNEVELKQVRLKIDMILEKNSKLIRFIKVVLKDNETSIDKIVKTVPISVETIKNYINNKERMLRYITEEQYKYLSNLIIPKIEKKTQIEKVIEAVLIDGITDLEKIEKSECIRRDVIKKYIKQPQELEKFLSKEDINIFVDKVNKMLSDIELEEYKKDKKYVAQIIKDILDTRYIYGDICAKHLFSIKKFEKYLYNEEYMKKEFPKITVEMVKQKIRENEKIRIRRPYDMNIVEDRFCVMIAKSDVHYLNQFDMKKLNVASYYLGTGADLEAVLTHYNIELPEALAILSSKKLDEVLNEQYHMILNHCLNIEKILYKNDLHIKKQFTNDIINFLENNNFDMELATGYYNIPVPLFNRVLKEIIRLPYASLETKETLKNLLNIEVQEKSK